MMASSAALALFHVTVNRGPSVVFQYTGFNIRVLLARFTEGAGNFFVVRLADIRPTYRTRCNFFS